MRKSILLEIHNLRKNYPVKWFKTFRSNLNEYFPEANATGPSLIQTQYNGTMRPDIFINYVRRTFFDFLRDLAASKAI